MCLDEVSNLLMTVPWHHDRYPEYLVDDLQIALRKLRDTCAVGSSSARH
jgi:hypothetical protein